MKIRLTIGNVLGTIALAAGTIAANEQIINLVTNTIGGKVAAAGALILAIAKSIVSVNTDKIPAQNKSSLGPLVLEKTLLK